MYNSSSRLSPSSSRIPSEVIVAPGKRSPPFTVFGGSNSKLKVNGCADSRNTGAPLVSADSNGTEVPGTRLTSTESNSKKLLIFSSLVSNKILSWERGLTA